MKTAIVYYSKHHGNTKKLLDAITRDHEVTLINAAEKEAEKDLSAYDRIGFASGIYYASFAKPLLKYAKENLPKGRKTFLIYTCGSKKNRRKYMVIDLYTAALISTIIRLFIVTYLY